jgi:hypothetical protein
MLRVDTGKTPAWRSVRRELIPAARSIVPADSEIFFLGGFPKTDFDTALQEARRRWALALKFDRALFLWSPGLSRSPREIAKDYGVSDPDSAESAWLEAIWLWPDVEDQELVAEKFWSMNETVEPAQTRVRRLERLVFLATKKGRVERARKLKAALDDPELRAKAAVNLQHLSPELWIRWTILSARFAKNTNTRAGWRANARMELGRIVPPTIGAQLDYDSLLVLSVFAQCIRWIDRHKKNIVSIGRRQLHKALSRSERAYILTALVLKASGYPRRPGPKQIRKIVKSSKYLEHLKSNNSRR